MTETVEKAIPEEEETTDFVLVSFQALPEMKAWLMDRTLHDGDRASTVIRRLVRDAMKKQETANSVS